jgi:hypothetical protein
MAWALQGLVSIEFTSEKYQFGEIFLQNRGFQTGPEWIGYSFCYMLPFTLISTTILALVLQKVRIEPERSRLDPKNNVRIGSDTHSDQGSISLPFIPVDLTFNRLVYEVKSSTGNETLRLLNEVSGVFKGGRMCALMG